MPFDSEFHIPIPRLLFALIIILAPITIFGLYVGLQASHQTQEMNGAYFRTISRGSAAVASQYVTERVNEVVQIANLPALQQAVMGANHAYQNVPEAAIRTKAEQMEAKWGNAESAALLKSVLGSDVAQAIRRFHELNPKLLSILVLDQAGATVAATDKPLHYFQTESEYWRTLSSKGQTKVYLSDVHVYEQSPTEYVSISAPVFQEGSGRFIGAVTALVDVSPLFSYLNQQQIGRSGRVFLIRDDGTVVAAAGVTPAERVKSDEYVAIRDALGTLHGRETGYLQATLPNRQSYLIGFADTGLKGAYPNLPWLIVVSQETLEAEGPIRNMVFFAMLMTVISLLALSVLGAYAFLHRKQRFEDIEEKPPEEVEIEPVQKARAKSA